MASPSKAKPRTESTTQSSTDTLHERLGILNNTLQSLIDTVKKVSDDISALQPLLVESAPSKPATNSSSSSEKKKTTKSSEEKTAATTTAKKATTKTEKKSPKKATEKESKKKATKSTTTTTATNSETSSDSPPTFLEAVNTLPIPELTDKLKNAKAKQNVINNVIKERKKLDFQPFSSIDDVVDRIKGLAKPSLDKIISDWS